MQPIAYRQRLTQVGYIGLVLGIGGPALSGVLLIEFYEALMARSQMAPMPPSPVVVIAGLTVASMIGWVMVLVGREHYPVTYDNHRMSGEKS